VLSPTTEAIQDDIHLAQSSCPVANRYYLPTSMTFSQYQPNQKDNEMVFFRPPEYQAPVIFGDCE
jgi:hypothetical protein